MLHAVHSFRLFPFARKTQKTQYTRQAGSCRTHLKPNPRHRRGGIFTTSVVVYSLPTCANFVVSNLTQSLHGFLSPLLKAREKRQAQENQGERRVEGCRGQPEMRTNLRRVWYGVFGKRKAKRWSQIPLFQGGIRASHCYGRNQKQETA